MFLEGVDEITRDRFEALQQVCDLGVTSAQRSIELQSRLFNEAVRKYGSYKAASRWVAPPGSSKHGPPCNCAIDAHGNLNCAHANAGRFGLYFPMYWEPWHLQPILNWSGTLPTKAKKPTRRIGEDVDIERYTLIAGDAPAKHVCYAGNVYNLKERVWPKVASLTDAYATVEFTLYARGEPKKPLATWQASAAGMELAVLGKDGKENEVWFRAGSVDFDGTLVIKCLEGKALVTVETYLTP